MPRQNRVLPNGKIVAIQDRGTLMGNRGRLHNAEGKIIRSFETKRWIICELEFQGIRREIMHPRSYTELFFLDEATALAAGHRPCFTCQRDKAKQFLRLSGCKNVNELDSKLHLDRLENARNVDVRTEYPSGTCFETENFDLFFLFEDSLFQWNEKGYEPCREQHIDANWKVVTPPTTLNILRYGYSVENPMRKIRPAR